MNRDIQRQTEQLNKKRLLRQRWHRWFSVPACAVVFVTAYALILPAITLDTAPDTYCRNCTFIPQRAMEKTVRCSVRRIRRSSSITTTAFASIVAASCSARYRRRVRRMCPAVWYTSIRRIA